MPKSTTGRHFLACLLLAAFALPASAVAVDLPESAKEVCRLYDGQARNVCLDLFKRASTGNVDAIYKIGVSVQGRPKQPTTDWQSFNLQDLTRREVEASWFRLAYSKGSLDAAYSWAKTIRTAFGIASQRTPPDFLPPGPELLRAALQVGTPGEALSAARSCNASPGCMSLLSDFYSEGFGGVRDPQLAIEWRDSAARAYARIGNRDLAVSEYRLLSRIASDHPLTISLRELLFPGGSVDAGELNQRGPDTEGKSYAELKGIDPEELVSKSGASATRLGDDGKTQIASFSETVSAERLQELESIVAALPKRLEVLQLCDQLRGMAKAKLIADSGLAYDVASVNYGYQGSILACTLKFMRDNKIGTQILFVKKARDTMFIAAFVD